MYQHLVLKKKTGFHFMHTFHIQNNITTQAFGRMTNAYFQKGNYIFCTEIANRSIIKL